MQLDYERIDPKIRDTIRRIDTKPHAKYIRYLLTKMYSPISIKKELQRLGLSAPHEPALTTYYLAIIDPVVKFYGLSSVYADYKNRLLRAKSKRGEYSKNIINYRLILGDDLDGQVKFCKMVKYLDIEEMWCREIYAFHGSVTNMPVDEDGNRIITATNSTRGISSVEKILTFDKRYLIDKLLLENAPADRIATYCRDKYKISVYDHDIKMYKAIFFNMQTQTIEEKIKSLISEKNELTTLIKDLDAGNGDFDEYEIGEKIGLRAQTSKRIDELDDSIKGLNALYSESAIRVAEAHNLDFERMFADIVGRTYSRFTQLDSHKDRDVVDPLYKCAKIMSFAHDKVEAIRVMGNGGKGGSNTDKHSQEVIMQLYGQRVDEIVEEEKKAAGDRIGDPDYGKVEFDDIEGIGELGLSFSEETGED